VRLIDQLGGLGRELPWTALAFGVGAVAIVGLPPLTASSRWVMVQGCWQGRPGLALFLLGVAGLGLIGALALACFSRAAGGVFLGQPRMPRAAVREEWGQVGPMLVLAAACIVIGLTPYVTVRSAMATTMTLLPAPVVPADAMRSVSSDAAATLGPAWLLLLLSRERPGSSAVGRAGPARERHRDLGCAYAEPTPRMQYTAGSFDPAAAGVRGHGRARSRAPARVAGDSLQ
jgi:formate hydrogenlyase subunit 3/multisubunit Na+/H+ antiporter MnhD subunit